MRRPKSTGSFFSGRNPNPRKWRRLPHLLVALASLYVLAMAARFVYLGGGAGSSSSSSSSSGGENDRLFSSTAALSRHLHSNPKPREDLIIPRSVYGRIASEVLRLRREKEDRLRRHGWTGNLTELERMAADARSLGLKAWEELDNYTVTGPPGPPAKVESCPLSVFLNGTEAVGTGRERVIVLPCGMEVGSAVTMVGIPDKAHGELVRGKRRGWVEKAMVSQFVVELQGLKAVDGEDPPRILHVNPRVKGDWSGRPVIEHNTCYRMQWGKAMRCDGLPSKDDEDTGEIL